MARFLCCTRHQSSSSAAIRSNISAFPTLVSTTQSDTHSEPNLNMHYSSLIFVPALLSLLAASAPIPTAEPSLSINSRPTPTQIKAAKMMAAQAAQMTASQIKASQIKDTILKNKKILSKLYQRDTPAVKTNGTAPTAPVAPADKDKEEDFDVTYLYDPEDDTEDDKTPAVKKNGTATAGPAAEDKEEDFDVTYLYGNDGKETEDDADGVTYPYGDADAETEDFDDSEALSKRAVDDEADGEDDDVDVTYLYGEDEN